MAIGRISGSVLKSNLTRNGTDLAFETNLLYLDVTNSRVGIGTSEPTTALQVNGTITGTLAGTTGSTIGNLTLANGSITDSSGAISFGDENLTTTGTVTASGITFPSSDGSSGQVLTTNGSGTLSFSDLSVGDLSIVGSTISSPSDADLTLTTAGTGTVVINGLSFPTGDGAANQVLATDGSGQLTFVNSGTASTDTEEAGAGDGTTDITGSQSVINSFNISTYDAAFYYVVSRDEVNQELDMKRHSLTHNDSAAVVNSFHVVESDENNSYLTVDADVSSNLARLIATGQSVSNSVSLYRVVLGPSTTASSDGNTAFIVNTDVDSAVENLDTWSASTYRGAHYQINATNTAKTESTNIEALVVTDGTSAFITTFGETSTGNHPLISLTADVSGGDVRLRVGGNEPNLRVVAYRVLLGDSESDSAGSSVNVVGATTVSSSATALDTMSADDYNAAWYVVVGHNSSEGASSIQLVNMLNDGTDAFVSQGPYVSSKGTSQLSFTGTFSGGTATLNCASTSGGSTTVNAYRVHLSRSAANTVTTNTTQTISGSKTFTSAILADTIRSPGSNADITLDPQGTGSVVIATGLTASGAIAANGSGNSITVADTLRIAQSGSGLRMTNVGAFDNDGSDNFRIFSTNDLILSSNGDSNTALTIDGTTQDVTINQDLGVTGTVTATNINVNSISSDDSSAIQINDAINVSGDITTAGTVVMDRLALSSGQTTVPPLQLTASSLNDGVGALRIDSVEPDIFLNDTDGGFATVTFGAPGDGGFGRVAFGRDNGNDFYLTVRDPSTNGGNWRNDTLVADSSTGDLSLGYDLSVAGSIALTVGSDPTTVTNKAHIYAKDESSSAEVFVRDEAGNVTKISPHNEQGEWEYYSRNVKTGKTVRINMEEMIRDIEKLTGKIYIKND